MHSRFVAPFMFGLVALAGVAGASTPVGAEEEEKNKPCVATKFETAEVQKACKEGGQKAAKALMKKVSDHTKAQGKEIKCKGCHDDMKTFKYTAEGLTDLKRILAELNAPAKPAKPTTPPAAPAPAPKPAGKP